MKRIKLSYIIVAICALLCVVDAKAQRLTFSSELGYFCNDENIPAISQVWKNYINAIDANFDTSQFWAKGRKDIHMSLHKDGLLNTYNIRKLSDDIYEINTIAYYPESAIPGCLVNTIYKVCAMRTMQGWQLMNYFDAIKDLYKHHSIGGMDFYIGNGVVADKKRMKESANFAESFIRRYSLNDDNHITYLAAGSIDECSAMVGLSYTPMRTHKKYAGRAMGNIILSTRLNHIHEVVHAIMLPLFPNAPLFLHEGIASYYGGMAEQPYKSVKSIARAYVEKENVDFSNKESLAVSLGNDIQLSNVVGAAIIEYVLQQGGESEVIRLFSAANYDQVFELLGVDNSQRANFIRGLFN